MGVSSDLVVFLYTKWWMSMTKSKIVVGIPENVVRAVVDRNLTVMAISLSQPFRMRGSYYRDSPCGRC